MSIFLHWPPSAIAQAINEDEGTQSQTVMVPRELQKSLEAKLRTNGATCENPDEAEAAPHGCEEID
jgi:hypothetical protein